MCNGALTIGPLDGANVEMAEEAGMDNIFIFGHTEKEISELGKTYSSREWMEKDAEINAAIKLIQYGFFNNGEDGIFDPLLKSLIDYNDRYFLFADLRMYHERHEEASKLYRDDQDKWNKMSAINIASSAKFSSDRTIKEYADEIWHIKPCKVKKSKEDSVLEDAKKTK